jgi:hypothetical protein
MYQVGQLELTLRLRFTVFFFFLRKNAALETRPSVNGALAQIGSSLDRCRY